MIKFLFVSLFIFYLIEIPSDELYTTNLVKDGYMVGRLPEDIESFEDIKKFTQYFFPDEYIFLNYKYSIFGTSLSTFHRDVTSSQNSLETKYPTYTLVLYQYDGNFISICPYSHITYPLTLNLPISISGKKNTFVIFNSDMLHAGQINTIGNKRKMIQFKIVHKDDYHKLKHLDDINVTKINDNDNFYIFELIIRKVSYYMSFLTNSYFKEFLISKTEDGIKGLIQDIIPIKFYNNV